MEDPVTHASGLVNVSDDGQFGRAVGSNLAIFAIPIPRLAGRLDRSRGLVLSWPVSSVAWRLEQAPALAGTPWAVVASVPQP